MFMKFLILLSFIFSAQVFAKSKCVSDMPPKYTVDGNYVPNPLYRGVRQPMSFSKDGKWLAVQTSAEVIRILNAGDGSLVQNLVASGSIVALQFSHDSQFLGVSIYKGPVEIFDLSSGKMIYQSQANNLDISRVVFTKDSHFAISARVVIDLQNKIEDVYIGNGLVELSPNERYYVSYEEWKAVTVVDLKNKKTVLSLDADENIQGVSFNAASTHLLIANLDGKLDEIDLQTGLRKNIYSFSEEFDTPQFYPEKSQVILRTKDDRYQYVLLFDYETKTILMKYQFGQKDTVYMGAQTFSLFHPSQNYIVASGEGYSEGRTQIVDTKSGKLETVMNTYDYGQTAEFNPSGSLLAFAIRDGSDIQVYDTRCMQ